MLSHARRTTSTRLAQVLLAAALSIPLLAFVSSPGQSPAVKAVHGTVTAGATASRVPGSVRAAALARLIAAEAGSRSHSPSVTVGMSASRPSTSTGTGVITGVVRSMAGRPFAAACVSAAGPAGSASAETKADGRYLLSGLRPGRYALRVLPCATATRAAGRSVVSLWPGMPGEVAVRAGQEVTVAPAMIVQRGRLGLVPASAGVRSKTGSISGVVTGAGRRLRGICVDAIPVNGGLIGEVRTSRTGRYRISHLPPGPYQVEFAGLDCQTSNWLAQWYPDINNPFGGGIELHVRAGKHISGIDAKLKLGGEISGSVRAKSGKKLAGICVTAIEILPKLNGEIIDGISTAKHGVFAFHGLFPGRYTFLFTIGCGNTGNYAFQWWKGAVRISRAAVIRISGRKVVSNVDPVLVPGATITGVVKGRSAAGPPLPGVCLYANDPDGIGPDATTGGGGHYALKGLATARYQVTFDPTCGQPPSPINYVGRTQTVTVKAGKTVSGFNAYLRPGAVLSGRVTDTHGRPLSHVCVQVNDLNGDLTATNHGNGTYSMNGIPPGSYTVAFFGGCGNRASLAPQFYNNQPDQGGANPVRFKSGKTTANIDAVMKPGGTIAGVVTGPAGHGLRGTCVSATPESGQMSPGDFAQTGFGNGFGQPGRYFITDLVPGPYLVEFNLGCSFRYASPWFNNQPDSTTADLLSVNPGVTTTVNARVGLAGSIAGTVTDKGGHRVSGECVIVFNARNQNPVSLPNGTTFPGRRGHYRIDGLSPGRYLIQFSQCTARPRYGSQWYRNKEREASATRVTVEAGRTTSGINAAVAIGGSISGTVTGPSGKPLFGICAEAFDAASQSFGLGQTGRRGRYDITGLAAGRYLLFYFPCASGPPNVGSVSRPGAVTVLAPKAATGINIKLKAGGSVSGLVTSAVSKSPQGGVCVLLLPVNPSNGDGFAVTGSNGRYTAPDLAPGKYHADFGDPFCPFTAQALAPQWYNDQPTESTATDITVTAGHTSSGINAVLESPAGITGTVTNRARAGVRGECVTAIPVAAPPDPFIGVPQPSEIAVTTHAGRYALSGLPGGRYKVRFTVGCGGAGYATQWWKDATSRKAATVITVGFATVGGIDAILRR